MFCANHPSFIIITSLIVCVALSAGISKFKVTTDPVELWSAPDSRAREKKAYFEEHFTPFYRTEQIIVTPQNNSPYGVKRFMDECTYYGPVMNRCVLAEVADLQNKLGAITVHMESLNKTISLPDICFAPLSPENEECTIISFFNYFQNNKTNLNPNSTPDFTINYVNIDHIDYYTTNPTAQVDSNPLLQKHRKMFSCLGAFGGPIFPRVALGGYEGTAYTNATALILTFTVNNFINDTFREMAEAWELEFINILKNYKGNHIYIAYTSERSIKDEIERESMSDVTTIVVSYMVMFV